MTDQSPKTPERAQEEQNDELFKTCKADIPTPATRLQLRQTPARLSILSGGQPFKESPSAKKFNLRNKRKQKNDTVDSNETFIKCEQELMFDRDSLEPNAADTYRRRSTRPDNKQVCEESPVKELEFNENDILDLLPSLSISTRVDDATKTMGPLAARSAEQEEVLPQEQQPDLTKGLNLIKNPDIVATAYERKRTSSPKQKQASSKKQKQNSKKIDTKPPRRPLIRKRLAPNQNLNAMPPPPPPPQMTRKNTFITPKPQAPSFLPRKPSSSFINVSSRYMSSSKLDMSRTTRLQSYRSTAELEKDYFKTLRSFR